MSKDKAPREWAPIKDTSFYDSNAASKKPTVFREFEGEEWVKLQDYATLKAENERLKSGWLDKHSLIVEENAALEAKLAEKEVELLGLKEGLEHLKYSVDQCSLAANVYRSKLAECIAALEYYAKSEGPSRVADGNLAGIVLARVKK